MVLTQGTTGPFGVADATARKLLVDAITNDRLGVYESDVIRSDLVTTAWRAYDRMPAAARGPATTAAFAWAKSYVSSPAFAAAYAQVREGRRPEGAANTPSVDEEAKRRLAEQLAAMEESRKMAESFPLPEKDKAALLAKLKEQEAQIKSPESQKMMRAVLEAELGQKVSAGSAAVAAWEARYPASPTAFVRDHLQRFLAGTAIIDYSLAAVVIKSPKAETMGFLSPGYTGMPWQHVHAILVGKEAVDAARAAAAAWVKELDGK